MAAFGAVIALNFQTVSMILFGYYFNEWAVRSYPEGFASFDTSTIVYSVTAIIILFNWYAIGRWYYLTQMKKSVLAEAKPKE
jgi:hypothetical protein